MTRTSSSAIADLIAISANRPLRLVEPEHEPAPLPSLRPPMVMTPAYTPSVVEQTWAVTRPVQRDRAELVKIGVGVTAFALLGVLLGAYVAFSGEGGKRVAGEASAAKPAPAKVARATTPAATKPVEKKPAPAPVAAPAPAPATAPAPAPAPVPAPAPSTLVQVRLESTPPGASATLVDSGRPRELGKTPVDVSIDRSHAYDVVFALEGHPTRIEHFDPTTTSRIAVELDPPQLAAAPAPAAAPPPPKPAPIAKKKSRAHTAAAHRARPETHRPAPTTAAPAAAEGTLMISAKPPCEIVVDGKSTGLVTPQRALALSAGVHTITFVNASRHLKKTKPVRITANRSTKLIENFL